MCENIARLSVESGLGVVAYWLYDFVVISGVRFRCLVLEDGFDVVGLPGLPVAANCSEHGGAWRVFHRYEILGE